MDLRRFSTNEETEIALEKLSKKQLQEIANTLELVGTKNWTKTALIQKIVFFGRIYPNQREQIKNMKLK